MSTTTPDNCRKDPLQWGQYSHQAKDSLWSGWTYHHEGEPSPAAKQRRDAWSHCVKLQYDMDLRLGRVFRWSHRPRTESPRQKLAAEFKDYADRWWNETRLLSSIQGKIFNHSYQRIIGMGKEVLPLIFADLKQRGGQWYWALECITGENPASTATTLTEARQMWLDYAVEHDHLPR